MRVAIQHGGACTLQVDVWDGTNFVSGVFSSRQSLDRFDRVPAVDPTPQDPQPSETSSVVASMEELGGSDAARPDNYDLDAVHKTTEDEAGALRDRIEALTSKVELALLTPDMLPTPRREPREAQSLAADVEARSAHELLHARQRTPDSSPPVRTRTSGLDTISDPNFLLACGVDSRHLNTQRLG